MDQKSVNRLLNCKLKYIKALFDHLIQQKAKDEFHPGTGHEDIQVK